MSIFSPAHKSSRDDGRTTKRIGSYNTRLMNVDLRYHFPPDLLTLLIDTIPRLNKSKADILMFFRGAAVPDELMADLAKRVKHDRDNIDKYEIARTVLRRLSDKGNIDHF